MAKRTKNLDRPEEKMPEHIRKVKPLGRGTSESVVDRGVWLDYDGISDWIAAFEAYDKRADKTPLLLLMRSERELPRTARHFLADLMERQFKKIPGTKLAAYDRTDHMVVLLAAKDEVAQLVKSRVSVKDALERVSEAREIPIEVLDKVYKDRHGGISRINKRTP